MHTTVAQALPEAKAKPKAAVVADPPKNAAKVEKYDVSIPIAKPSLKPQAPAAIPEESLFDPENAVIAAGTRCKRKGCDYSFVNDTCRSAVCDFHPGGPVFHDSSKGWSCCNRKVLEFDEFLKIPGCTQSVHRFLVLLF